MAALQLSVDRLLQGGAMGEFVLSREMWVRLKRRIGKRIGKRADAEDLLHSAYLRLVGYQSHHPVENVEAFLVRTALNIGVDNFRRDRFFSEIPAVDAVFANNAPLQDEALAAQERLRRVKEGLARLPARTRDILMMHRLEGLTYHEIGERLGISRSGVEKHIIKAMRYLAVWSEGW